MAFRLRLRGPNGKQHDATFSAAATLAELQQEASGVFNLNGMVQVLLGFPPSVCDAASSTPLSELLQSGDSVTVREGQAEAPPGLAGNVAAERQIEDDEAFARLLAAEEAEPLVESQIEADEQFARQLAAEADAENQQQHHSQLPSNTSPDVVNVEHLSEALETLAPLRNARRFRDGHMSTMLDNVFQQLEGLIANSNSTHANTRPSNSRINSATAQEQPPTTTETLPPGGQSTHANISAPTQTPISISQEAAVRAAARTGSVEAVLAAVGASIPSARPTAPTAAPPFTPLGFVTQTGYSGVSVPTDVQHSSASSSSGHNLSSVVVVPGDVPVSSETPSTNTTMQQASSSSSSSAPTSSSAPADYLGVSVPTDVQQSSPSSSLVHNLSSIVEGSGDVSGSSATPSTNTTMQQASSSSSSSAPTSSSAPAVSSSASGTGAPGFASYMARVEARRSERQRRRAERLTALNAALDAHMIAGFASLEQVPPAGDSNFVDNHSTTSVWGADAEERQCVICCEDLAEGDNVRTLPCGHVYHQECIDLWLQRSRLCCLCKRPIDQAP